MNPAVSGHNTSFSDRKPRAFGLLVPFTVLWLAARPAAPPPPRLEIHGERAPVNFQTAERDQVPFASALALSWLDWQVAWHDKSRTLEARQGNVTVRLQADAEQARVEVSGENPPRSLPAMRGQGQLLLPASAFQEVFHVPVDWDASTRTLRLGEVPAPAPEEVRAWCDALGVKNTSVFHQSAFRIVTLKITGGQRELKKEQDFALIVRTNKAGYLQIYEKVNDEEAEPLLDSQGKEYYPQRFGRAATPYPVRPQMTERWALGATLPGKVSYIALATTLKTEEDLREVLQRPNVTGEWAMVGLPLTVKP